LLRAHRGAKDQRQFLDAEFFDDQPMLRANVVADGDARKTRGVERRRRIARRGRKAVANLIDQNDEIFAWIERPPRADIGLFDDLARARIPGRKQDRIVFLRRQRPEGRIGELQTADRAALLEFEIAEIIGFKGPVVP
jgi:hypothetical protein